MQNSKLCDISHVAGKASIEDAFQRTAQTSSKDFMRQLEEVAESSDVNAEKKKDVARQFASVFYTMLFKTMQETIPDDGDGSAMSQGMKGLVSRYIPRVMANTSSDPISRYIEKNLDLEKGRGGDINEQA